MTLTRRRLLAGGLFGLAACESAGSALMKSERLAASGTFSSGVASGDPRTDSVVLWTRAAPAGAGGTVSGMAELSDSPDFDRIVWSARFETGPSRDYTVKLVADSLEPGRRYHYRFRSGDAVATGRTRTLPEQAERARFAIVSCSNYPFGYFNAYDHIARGDFDAVVHLGDTSTNTGAEAMAAMSARRSAASTSLRTRSSRWTITGAGIVSINPTPARRPCMPPTP